MEVAHISSIPFLKRNEPLTRQHMALAHLAEEHEEYRSFHRTAAALGDFVTLDNSVIELGEAVPIDYLVKLADEIGAVEIVLPDAFKDMDKTLSLIDRAVRRVPDHLRAMAVPQGSTAEEWLECAYQIVVRYWRDIRTIGIPKVTTTLFDGGRLAALEAYCEMLLQRAQFYPNIRDIHLLGIWEDPREVHAIACSQYGRYVRSVDSCMAYLAAQEGVRFDLVQWPGRPARKMDFHSELTPEQETLFYYNAKKLEVWARGRPKSTRRFV